MKILVCISSVPDTTSKINFTPDDKNFDPTGVQFIINPTDEFSLSKAIDLKEQGAEVTVLGMGDTSIEPILRKALATGADNAIRINGNPSDSKTVAKELATYIKNNPFDIIFTGKESIDYNGSIVAALLAAYLDIPFINACTSLTITGQDVLAERDLDGSKEKITGQLPIIIAGQKGIVREDELKIPNMRGIMAARTKPLAVVEANSSEKTLEVVSYEKPPMKSAVKMFSIDQLTALVDQLKNDTQAF